MWGGVGWVEGGATPVTLKGVQKGPHRPWGPPLPLNPNVRGHGLVLDIKHAPGASETIRMGVAAPHSGATALMWTHLLCPNGVGIKDLQVQPQGVATRKGRIARASGYF